jgi:1,4-alpha-glucan branching enzyme
MPVHAFVDERKLVEKKLRNYWGCNSIGFFAPDMRYAATGLVNEFKSMVKRLHSAGLEVIVDVVYTYRRQHYEGLVLLHQYLLQRSRSGTRDGPRRRDCTVPRLGLSQSTSRSNRRSSPTSWVSTG